MLLGSQIVFAFQHTIKQALLLRPMMYHDLFESEQLIRLTFQYLYQCLNLQTQLFLPESWRQVKYLCPWNSGTHLLHYKLCYQRLAVSNSSHLWGSLLPWLQSSQPIGAVRCASASTYFDLLILSFGWHFAWNPHPSFLQVSLSKDGHMMLYPFSKQYLLQAYRLHF